MGGGGGGMGERNAVVTPTSKDLLSSPNTDECLMNADFHLPSFL